MSTLDRIIELLEKNHKNQKDLTDYLKLDKSTFSAWKNKRNHSYRKYVKEIAEYFDVTTDYLVGNDYKQADGDGFRLEGMYFKLGREAQELGLDDEDIENILKLYRKQKRSSS